MTAYLDWTDDAEDAVREHYSRNVYRLDMAMLAPLPPEQPAEEFAVEYNSEVRAA